MANTIRIKRGLKENISSLTLLPGELAVAIDTLELFIGNQSNQPELIKASSAGAVESADKLTVARTLTGTGDASFVFTFDGSSNVEAAVALAASGVTAGTYSKITVDDKGRVTKGENIQKEDLPDITIEDIEGLQAGLDAKADKSTTYSKDEVDSLLKPISTKVTTNEQSIQSEVQRATEAESALSTKITALSGTVIYLGLIENTNEEITGNTTLLDEKAKSLKGNVSVGYTLIDSDKHEWVCNEASDNVGSWVDMGITTVATATNSIAGIVKGSTQNFMVSINEQGEMSVNKLQETISTIQENISSVTDQSNTNKTDIDNLKTNKLDKTDVVASTGETTPGKALDATIGKTLNDELQSKINDASADGKVYARQNNNWVEVEQNLVIYNATATSSLITISDEGLDISTLPKVIFIKLNADTNTNTTTQLNINDTVFESNNSLANKTFLKNDIIIVKLWNDTTNYFTMQGISQIASDNVLGEVFISQTVTSGEKANITAPSNAAIIAKIGNSNLSDLSTSNKTGLVEAINELNTDKLSASSVIDGGTF